MLWNKVDQRWKDRLTKTREGDVSWTTEQWPVPGEDPLEVRVCVRDKVPVTKFANAQEAPRTSIVLHLTCGYGNFTGLMGGSDHSASAHFLLGRCGTPYQLVPTEFTSWHATWWNNNSIGIEVDNIGGLHAVGDDMCSEYSSKAKKDVYCKKSETDCFLEKKFGGTQFWATLTEAQYAGLGKLIKALCFKHKIPRIIPPEDLRYKAFDKANPKVRQNYRGICTHVNIDPARRADIGPYIDWPKLITYGGVTEADCYNPPDSVGTTWNDPRGGGAGGGGDDQGQGGPADGDGGDNIREEPAQGQGDGGDNVREDPDQGQGGPADGDGGDNVREDPNQGQGGPNNDNVREDPDQGQGGPADGDGGGNIREEPDAGGGGGGGGDSESDSGGGGGGGGDSDSGGPPDNIREEPDPGQGGGGGPAAGEDDDDAGSGGGSGGGTGGD